MLLSLYLSLHKAKLPLHGDVLNKLAKNQARRRIGELFLSSPPSLYSISPGGPGARFRFEVMTHPVEK